jgi:hypothetical protein
MAAAAVMSGIGILATIGMVVGIARDGINAQTSVDDNNKKVEEIKKNNKTLEESYQKLLDKTTVLDDNLLSDIKNALNAQTTLSQQIKVYKEEYNVYYRNIQLYGIIYIVIIFILLLLKLTGIIGSISPLFPNSTLH